MIVLGIRIMPSGVGNTIGIEKYLGPEEGDEGGTLPLMSLTVAGSRGLIEPPIENMENDVVSVAQRNRTIDRRRAESRLE